ncbi:MAG: DNA repair protein RecO [Candidatus Saccharimonadales bacterium]
MKQLVARAIVLSRIDYGEADRIITLLTPDAGKLRLMARGVRRPKSKLAGGIELFSVSDITYIMGKGDLGTLISARLDRHYRHIVRDITRVQLGYELIKQLHKITEDNPEEDYFDLLQQSFAGLDSDLDTDIIRLWFLAQLLRLSGSSPNLATDNQGRTLEVGVLYSFDFDSMAFDTHPSAQLSSAHIKVMRLLFNVTELASLRQVQGISLLLPDVSPLLHTMRQNYLNI